MRRCDIVTLKLKLLFAEYNRDIR